jgi:hypothetical protein
MTLGTIVATLGTLAVMIASTAFAWFEGGGTFNPSISLNGILITGGTLVSAIFAWRDLNWRQKNAEERIDKIEKLMEANNLQLQKFNESMLKQDARMQRIEEKVDKRNRSREV